MMSLWQQCVDDLSLQMDKPNHTIWICPLQPALDHDTLTLFAPNRLVADRVREDYLTPIQETLSRVTKQNLDVKLVVGSSSDRDPPQSPQDRRTTKTLHQRLLENNLNPQQRFDTFVTGDSNRLAYHAARAVMQQPEQNRPLFLCGDIGCGKTHLLNAIGVAFIEQTRSKKIFFFPAEQLANRLVKAMRARTIESFKNQLNRAELLLIDDLKMLAGKVWVQKELLLLYESLLARGSRIILTDEHSPNQLPLENQRLVSRFSAGLTCRIDTPSQETLIAILKQTGTTLGITLDEACAGTIAARIEPSARLAEGTLHRIIAELQHRPEQKLSPGWIGEILDNHHQRNHRHLAPDEILKQIAQALNVSVTDLCSGSRQKQQVQTRHIAMSLLRDLTTLSLPGIAALFGCSHTTVLNAIRRIQQQRKTSPRLDKQYKDLLQMLK